jgi:hypothetical protein
VTSARGSATRMRGRPADARTLVRVGLERVDGVREKLIRADELLQAIERATAEYIV